MIDLVKETHRWCLGACLEWNQQMQQFSDTSGRDFLDFVNRTHTVVYRYLQGRQTLDGTCSDLECNLAIQARQIFWPHLTQM